MKCRDIKRIMDEGLSNLTVTEQDIDAVMNRIHEEAKPHTRRAIGERRRRRHGMRKAVLIAIVLVFLFSVVAQAVGIPVWEIMVTWTQEKLMIDISFEGSRDGYVYRRSFTDEEREVWGANTCNVLEEIGRCPCLPTIMPEGFSYRDMFFMEDGIGYCYVSTLYSNDDGENISMVVEVLDGESYTYGVSIEWDQKSRREVIVDGVKYIFVSNLGTNTVYWYSDIFSCSISGPISFDDMEAMIRSMPEKENAN